jgi:hypothetical protein
VIGPGNREAALKVIERRSELARKKEELEVLRQRSEEGKRVVENQEQKRAEVEKSLSSEEKRRKEALASVEKARNQRRRLEDQVHRSREQSVVLEYRSKLLSGESPQDCHEFLWTMLKLSFDAPPLLTEVARLRDHYRAESDKMHSRGVKMSQNDQRCRREIAEKKVIVADLKRKLEKVQANAQIADCAAGAAEVP